MKAKQSAAVLTASTETDGDTWPSLRVILHYTATKCWGAIPERADVRAEIARLPLSRWETEIVGIRDDDKTLHFEQTLRQS